MGAEKSINPIYFSNRDQSTKNANVIDIYEDSLKELFFIDHPHYVQFKKNQESIKDKIQNYIKNIEIDDIWIYLPWKNCIIHTVEEKVYFKLRTARNRNIITEKEQKKYREIKVGIIGLSIGSVILSSLVTSGGPKYIKLADYDEIEVSNLNRMKATILDIKKNKAEVAAINSWEIDPFLDLTIWRKEVTKDSIEAFILKKPKLDVFIDSMDSLELKIIARQICKKAKIPCLMATSNGDSEIFDVERFDLEPNRPLFHGRLGDITSEDFKYTSQSEWLQKALQVVEDTLLTERVKQSISEVGKSLAGVPQLSTTLQVSGALMSYAIRQIANNYPLPSGRYISSIDKVFELV